jgi:2-amino-4-hydroxy-6-hydroxymethyldihydropteridine diphosphokinase
LPHPRLDMRAFVIIPLLEIAPNWYHPVSGLAAAQLVEALPTSQFARPLAGQA